MADGVVLVTGAARGIGAAVARSLVQSGRSVVLLDRCEDDPDLDYPLATPGELAELAGSLGTRCAGVVMADVRHQDGLAEAVEIAEANGGLRAVAAVAGALVGGPPFWECSEPQWQAMLQINLTGTWQTLRAAVPAMLREPPLRSGRIVVVASAASLQGMPRLAAYCAAKHGLVGLVRSAAAELAPEGITVNAVAPGSTRTGLLDASAAVYDLDSVEEFAAHHLAPRLVEPEEVAAAVTFLLGPRAGAMTGAVVPVDLGMTAG